jgi:hypothetical protein
MTAGVPIGIAGSSIMKKVHKVEEMKGLERKR